MLLSSLGIDLLRVEKVWESTLSAVEQDSLLNIQVLFFKGHGMIQDVYTREQIGGDTGVSIWLSLYCIHLNFIFNFRVYFCNSQCSEQKTSIYQIHFVQNEDSQTQ